MPYGDQEPYITPKEARESVIRWTPTIALLSIIVLVVAGVTCLIGWQVGGWWQTHSIQRNYSNTVNSQAYQESLIPEMDQHLANISGPGGVAATRASVPASSPEQVNLRAQELSEITLFCAESVNFNPLSGIPGAQDLATVVSANCLAGAPVASPPLANPVPEGN